MLVGAVPLSVVSLRLGGGQPRLFSARGWGSLLCSPRGCCRYLPWAMSRQSPGTAPTLCRRLSGTCARAKSVASVRVELCIVGAVPLFNVSLRLGGGQPRLFSARGWGSLLCLPRGCCRYLPWAMSRQSPLAPRREGFRGDDHVEEGFLLGISAGGRAGQLQDAVEVVGMPVARVA